MPIVDDHNDGHRSEGMKLSNLSTILMVEKMYEDISFTTVMVENMYEDTAKGDENS